MRPPFLQASSSLRPQLPGAPTRTSTARDGNAAAQDEMTLRDFLDLTFIYLRKGF